MIDEMYLQKSAQYQSGDYVEEGNLHKGIFSFMVAGLKQSIPFVQTIPEFTFNGHCVAKKISGNIDHLIEIGLSVQGVVTTKKVARYSYRQSANISAFSTLIKITL